MFKNLFLRRYAYTLCNVSLNTPIACSLVCFPGMTSSLAKVNKSSGAHCLAIFLKFSNFLMFLNIQIDLLILKTYYGQFTLTTKKSLHIIFKVRSHRVRCATAYCGLRQKTPQHDGRCHNATQLTASGVKTCIGVHRQATDFVTNCCWHRAGYYNLHGESRTGSFFFCYSFAKR